MAQSTRKHQTRSTQASNSLEGLGTEDLIVNQSTVTSTRETAKQK